MTDRKGLVPVTQDEVIAGRLCEWSKDGEPPVPLMQEAANLIRHRADALTEALRVVREAREDFADIEAEMAFPNQMEAGFAHGKPTLKDMTQRVELAKSIASVANATLTAFIAQYEGERP